MHPLIKSENSLPEEMSGKQSFVKGGRAPGVISFVRKIT